MRLLLIVAAALSLAGATHGAEIDPRTSVSSFTLANIMAAAQAVNFKAEALSDGTKQAVGITPPNGMKFVAQPVTCQKPNQVDCFGLAILGVYSGWQPSAQQLNYFNKHRNFTKTYQDEGNVMLVRYEIADYGIPLGNISSNIANFAAVAAQFRQFLESGGTNASYIPAPDTHILGGFGAAPQPVEIEEALFKPSAQNGAYTNRRDN